MQIDPDTVTRDVRVALTEDIGSGDLSADLIAPDVQVDARVVTRDAGVFCGRPWVDEACRQVDPEIALHWRVQDGSNIAPGDALVDLDGPARSLLSVERTAINFMQLLSATATQARRYVDAVAGTGAVVLDTRKTLPGLRAAQKYAVRMGGAQNHRLGLYDAILLKENHLAAAGSIDAAVREARRIHPREPVEIEVENHDELRAAIAAGVDRVLLDNFALADLEEAVAITAGRVPLEASGGIALDNVAAIARTGVSYVSIGEITKRVVPLDLSMRIG
ncbi:MAG: carboxylating nicotinate-nucleotide diphosphorylase [Gammaproteobacteria bacterium]|nr:carboxylating nicotinate-nucleotide diphosphorylase [Gammaproteobacteria bacterium]